MPKLYEVWPSNNNIYCRGALITGPDRVAFWISELLVFATFILFWIFICIPFGNEYVWSPLVINRTWGSHKETSDGESYDISFTVTGEATTTVPAGEYDTYTVEGTGMFAGSPSVEELWWAPQIGAPVKRHIVAVDSVSGKTLDLTLELKSRNR